MEYWGGNAIELLLRIQVVDDAVELDLGGWVGVLNFLIYGVFLNTFQIRGLEAKPTLLGPVDDLPIADPYLIRDRPKTRDRTRQESQRTRQNKLREAKPDQIKSSLARVLCLLGQHRSRSSQVKSAARVLITVQSTEYRVLPEGV